MTLPTQASLPLLHPWGTIWTTILLLFLIILAFLLLMCLLYFQKKSCWCCFSPTLLFLLFVLYFVIYGSYFFLFRMFFFPTVDSGWSIGMVDHKMAKIWVMSEGDKSVGVVYKEANSPKEFTTGFFPLTASNDWTTVFTISGLIPKTTYNWWITSDLPLKQSMNGSFTTFPEPERPTQFSFNYGSCIEPKPWTFMEFFLFWLDQKIDFTLLLGDTIYTDLFGDIPHDQAYQQLFSDPIFSDFFRKIPNFWMYDDHEIYNDYDKGSGNPFFQESLQYWRYYLGNKNPDPISKNGNFFEFEYGNVGFFVLDIRMNRSPSGIPDSPKKTMLGAEQKEKLFRWLLENSKKKIFKFIASPVPWTVSITLEDGWRSFLREREEIVDFIVAHNITGVILLSADVHYPIVSTITQPWLLEYSVSPLQSIPLFPSSSFNVDSFYDTHGKLINDTVLFVTGIEYSGYAHYFGHIKVRTTEEDGEVDFQIYAYNGGGREPKMVYELKRKLVDTVPKQEHNDEQLPVLDKKLRNEL